MPSCQPIVECRKTCDSGIRFKPGSARVSRALLRTRGPRSDNGPKANGTRTMHTYLTDQKLRKEERLLDRAEFDAVFEKGRSVGNKLLVLHWLDSERGHPRLGLVIGTRFGNAVKRNQWKRRIREIYRRNKQAIASRDIVVLPSKRPEAKEADHAAMQEALLSLLKRMA